MKNINKYEAFWKWIKKNKKDDFTLSFDEIRDILGFNVDHSFLNSKKELEQFGFVVDKISLKDKIVKFKKT